MEAIIAIGAAVAVLTGIGAGVGIGIGSRGYRKTAGGRGQDQQEPDSRMCACRGNSYLRFHHRTSDYRTSLIDECESMREQTTEKDNRKGGRKR